VQFCKQNPKNSAVKPKSLIFYDDTLQCVAF